MINGYDLSRQWFNFCYENPDRITPTHTAMYFFAIDHCNRLGWKEKFGFPTTMVMEAIGIKSYNTYKKIFSDLIDFGFIQLIKKSSNQYSANVIALSKINKALNKPLDKALMNHLINHSESIEQSIDSIIKQLNNKQLNKEQLYNLQKILEANNFKIDDIISDEVNQDCNLQVEKSRKFYDKQIELNKDKSEISLYKKFIDVLFGDNKTQEIYTGVLSIPIQIKYDVFCDILKDCEAKGKRLSSILMKMNNKEDYYKNFKSLPIMIYSWLETDFK